MSVLLVVMTVVCLNGIVYWMPKRITTQEMFATAFFAVALQQTVDIYLCLKYNLYGYFGGGIRMITGFAIFGIYPATTVLYLNFFPYRRRLLRKVFYVAGWSCFALAYEWLADFTGFFYHHGWKYWYSAIAYPLLFLTLSAALWAFRRLGSSAQGL